MNREVRRTGLERSDGLSNQLPYVTHLYDGQGTLRRLAGENTPHQRVRRPPESQGQPRVRAGTQPLVAPRGGRAFQYVSAPQTYATRAPYGVQQQPRILPPLQSRSFPTRQPYAPSQQTFAPTQQPYSNPPQPYMPVQQPCAPAQEPLLSYPAMYTLPQPTCAVQMQQAIMAPELRSHDDILQDLATTVSRARVLLSALVQARHASTSAVAPVVQQYHGPVLQQIVLPQPMTAMQIVQPAIGTPTEAQATAGSLPRFSGAQGRRQRATLPGARSHHAPRLPGTVAQFPTPSPPASDRELNLAPTAGNVQVSVVRPTPVQQPLLAQRLAPGRAISPGSSQSEGVSSLKPQPNTQLPPRGVDAQHKLSVLGAAADESAARASAAAWLESRTEASRLPFLKAVGAEREAIKTEKGGSLSSSTPIEDAENAANVLMKRSYSLWSDETEGSARAEKCSTSLFSVDFSPCLTSPEETPSTPSVAALLWSQGVVAASSKQEVRSLVKHEHPSIGDLAENATLDTSTYADPTRHLAHRHAGHPPAPLKPGIMPPGEIHRTAQDVAGEKAESQTTSPLQTSSVPSRRPPTEATDPSSQRSNVQQKERAPAGPQADCPPGGAVRKESETGEAPGATAGARNDSAARATYASLFKESSLSSVRMPTFMRRQPVREEGGHSPSRQEPLPTHASEGAGHPKHRGNRGGSNRRHPRYKETERFSSTNGRVFYRTVSSSAETSTVPPRRSQHRGTPCASVRRASTKRERVAQAETLISSTARSSRPAIPTDRPLNPVSDLAPSPGKRGGAHKSSASGKETVTEWSSKSYSHSRDSAEKNRESGRHSGASLTRTTAYVEAVKEGTTDLASPRAAGIRRALPNVAKGEKGAHEGGERSDETTTKQTSNPEKRAAAEVAAQPSREWKSGRSTDAGSSMQSEAAHHSTLGGLKEELAGPHDSYRRAIDSEDGGPAGEKELVSANEADEGERGGAETGLPERPPGDAGSHQEPRRTKSKKVKHAQQSKKKEKSDQTKVADREAKLRPTKDSPQGSPVPVVQGKEADGEIQDAEVRTRRGDRKTQRRDKTTSKVGREETLALPPAAAEAAPPRPLPELHFPEPPPTTEQEQAPQMIGALAEASNVKEAIEVLLTKVQTSLSSSNGSTEPHDSQSGVTVDANDTPAATPDNLEVYESLNRLKALSLQMLDQSRDLRATLEDMSNTGDEEESFQNILRLDVRHKDGQWNSDERALAFRAEAFQLAFLAKTRVLRKVFEHTVQEVQKSLDMMSDPTGDGALDQQVVVPEAEVVMIRRGLARAIDAAARARALEEQRIQRFDIVASLRFRQQVVASRDHARRNVDACIAATVKRLEQESLAAAATGDGGQPATTHTDITGQAKGTAGKSAARSFAPAEDKAKSIHELEEIAAAVWNNLQKQKEVVSQAVNDLLASPQPSTVPMVEKLMARLGASAQVAAEALWGQLCLHGLCERLELTPEENDVRERYARDIMAFHERAESCIATFCQKKREAALAALLREETTKKVMEKDSLIPKVDEVG
ncbi:hypothetical protein BESB_008010 [Besnoitia besnoiti]|uniref:Uncharacterized protein n=1 Tax=Besnoitia besnoiti TaxID=94643 RepID=A0A2A9MKJ5_BESBE|nr:hypothetical protein BESB_008010 [Besnoitia besnoiti]PFH38459.1 hypothetical protein BESB_008010 [Besnoitia besnoiti]